MRNTILAAAIVSFGVLGLTACDVKKTQRARRSSPSSLPGGSCCQFAKGGYLCPPCTTRKKCAQAFFAPSRDSVPFSSRVMFSRCR